MGGQVEESSQSGHVATEPESHQEGKLEKLKKSVCCLFWGYDLTVHAVTF